MKLQIDSDHKNKLEDKGISLDIQLDILLQTLHNVLGDGVVKTRIIKYKLQKLIKSSDNNKKLYAINKIISEGKGINTSSYRRRIR